MAAPTKSIGDKPELRVVYAVDELSRLTRHSIVHLKHEIRRR